MGIRVSGRAAKKMNMKTVGAYGIAAVLLTFGVGFAACGKKGGKGKGGSSKPPKMPSIQVTKTAKLMFTYKEGDEFKTVDHLDKVPVGARGRVKVMDPSVRGISGQFVYVANLCRPDKNGQFPYVVVPLQKFEAADSIGCSGKGGPPRFPTGKALGTRAGTRVIMYMTKTCPVCVRAERFMKAKNIPYVAKDVGSDQNAARELAAKAARAGITARGVPVFDIGGRLIQGFEPSVIERLASKKL